MFVCVCLRVCACASVAVYSFTYIGTSTFVYRSFDKYIPITVGRHVLLAESAVYVADGTDFVSIMEQNTVWLLHTENAAVDLRST